MSEYEPQLRILSANYEVHSYDREHAFLYTHVGQLACYDHVFLLDVEEDGSETGQYMWKSDPAYEDSKQFMIDNEFPLHMNLPDVTEEDKEIFDWHFLADASDTMPEGWSDESRG